MNKTSVCHLIENTPLEIDLEPKINHFIFLKNFTDENHLIRHLLQCKICGQLYFYEFNEEIDWDAGNDSQYKTYIPVSSVAEADALNKKSELELLGVKPRLQSDLGKNNIRTVRWIR